MWKNNIKLAFRNLFRQKTQSLILIMGLTMGIAACLLILQYVNFEWSYDHFHQNKASIYRVVNERIQNGKTVQKGTITYPTIGPTMQEEYPEVLNATRIFYSSGAIVSREDLVESVGQTLWVDEHFMEIFDFKLLSQDKIGLLDEPNEVILTQTLADRYFPGSKRDYDAIVGKEIRIDRDEDAYRIVGVVEDCPRNSLLQFELLGSFGSVIRYLGERADNSWQWSDFYHYLQLAPGTDPADLESKFTDFSQRHFNGTEVTGSEEVFTLQPLAEAHLNSADLEYEIGTTSNGQAVWSMLIIAFFILVIAWINYVNLSSVKAIERAKEVGVRKVVGASRKQLTQQFMAEALVVNLLSLGLALLVVWSISPWFSSTFGLTSTLSGPSSISNSSVYLIAGLVGFMVLGIFLSAAYPSWLLSTPHITKTLKGIMAKDIGGINLRKGLVVFQFVMSIALIAGTWLVSRQIAYMSKQDLGININQVMSISPPQMSQWDSTFIDRMNTFKKELTNIVGVENATTSSRTPGQRMGRIFAIQKMGSDAGEQIFTSNFINVDFDYAATYDLEPLAGRFFRRSDHNYDFNQVDNIVISKAAIEMLGYSDADQALQQNIRFWDKNWTIIGVIPDFHQRSLHHEMEPILFLPSYSPANSLSLKISSSDIDGVIAQVNSTYQAFFPGNTFDYSFIDDNFQRLYEADRQFGNILSFFTFLTILIACLGLFGLASYATYLRTKEIGIRKILGASVASIIGLLSIDFLKLVGIAIVIAVPFTYFIIQWWLQDFAYSININFWIFVLAGIAALLIAFFTISFHSIRVALANPSSSLRQD